MKLLHIDSSILGANSTSRLLSAETVTAWRAAHPDTSVDYLDLAVDTPRTSAPTRWASRPACKRSRPKPNCVKTPCRKSW
jgi:FMN-dependent NADH-azoreductase